MTNAPESPRHQDLEEARPSFGEKAKDVMNVVGNVVGWAALAGIVAYTGYSLHNDSEKRELARQEQAKQELIAHGTHLTVGLGEVPLLPIKYDDKTWEEASQNNDRKDLPFPRWWERVVRHKGHAIYPSGSKQNPFGETVGDWDETRQSESQVIYETKDGEDLTDVGVCIGALADASDVFVSLSKSPEGIILL